MHRETLLPRKADGGVDDATPARARTGKNSLPAAKRMLSAKAGELVRMKSGVCKILVTKVLGTNQR
jgi:hypothetical protein